MSTPLPDDDRDLRLARRLDAGAEPDGADPLHDALRAVRPEAKPVEAETSERLWVGIEREIGRPAKAPDRQPLRLVRRRVVQWAAAATLLLAVGAGVWMMQRGPELVAAAGAEVVIWGAPDGSTVTLRPHSRLVRLDDDERAYRLEGEAFFAVAHDPDRPFTVEAGAAIVRVLGTRFDVSTWGDQTAVYVEEGRVELRGVSSEIVLGAGEAAQAGAGGVAAMPDANAEVFLDWQRGEIVFERESVRRVVDEIAQHFAATIMLDASVARATVSGVIVLESAPQALGDLGRILGGRFEPYSGGYRFVRS